MRLALLLLLVIASGCASPCESVNADQNDAAMQTCAFSARLDGELPMAFSTEAGAPVAFTVSPAEPMARELPDGSRLDGAWGTDWVPAGEPTPPHASRDSTRMVASADVAPEAGRYALGMHWDGTVRVFGADGEPLARVRVAEGMDPFPGLKWPNSAKHVTFAREGEIVVSGDALNNVAAWDAETGERRWSTRIEQADSRTGITGLAVSPDGLLVTASTSRAVHVWNAASGETVAAWTFPKKGTFVVDLAFAPDGRYVVVQKSGRRTAAQTSSTPNSSRGVQQTEASAGTPTVFLMALP